MVVAIAPSHPERCCWEIYVLWRGRRRKYGASLLKPLSLGRVAFEKLTDLDYKGETYYTIRFPFKSWIRNHHDLWLWNVSETWACTSARVGAGRSPSARRLHSGGKTLIILLIIIIIITIFILIFILYSNCFQLLSFVVNPLTPRQETICLLQVSLIYCKLKS